MPKTLAQNYLGGPATPQDIKDLRQNSFDYHRDLGYPVIFKHRWTEKDLREGLVEQCPLHDDIYDGDLSWDPVCFGTGYVGGYRDGDIIYVSISDAPQDVIKITPQGILQYDHHPQMTAPWFPTMQDNDLIIVATFDPETWEIVDLAERYTLREVNQITMRGPGYQRQGRNAIGKPFTVHQEAAVDKLPYGHPLYNVPVVFDSGEVPPDVDEPGDDPYDPGDDGPGTYSAVNINVRIKGAEQLIETFVEREIHLDVEGDPGTVEGHLRIYGEGEGVIIHW
jgi:hypothetical protein